LNSPLACAAVFAQLLQRPLIAGICKQRFHYSLRPRIHRMRQLQRHGLDPLQPDRQVTRQSASQSPFSCLISKICKHEGLAPSKAPTHSSQNTSSAEYDKASAKDKESSSKPALTCSPSAACPPESTSLASAAQPKRPASFGGSSRLSKQTTIGLQDESAPESHDHAAGPSTRSQSPRADNRSYPKGCCGTYATLLVTIAREFTRHKCYS